MHVQEIVNSKTRTYHGRVGAGRPTAGRQGGAGSGSTRRQWVGSPRIQPTFSGPLRTTLLGLSLTARTKEFLCKPMGEQNKRLASSWPAVGQRFICRTTATVRSRLPTSALMHNCLYKLFSSKACPENCRIPNQNKSQAGRGRGAERGHAGGDPERSVRQENSRTCLA